MSDVVIAGGGLGGLAAALALAREDVAVTVLESAEAPPPDRFGYTLWPPGTRVLEWLGVLDEVAAEGCRLEALRWYDDEGAEWSSVRLAALGELGRFVGVRPSRVVAALRAAAERAGARVLDGMRDWSVDAAGQGWEIRCGSEALRCAVLVGCDGPRSRVREQMGVRAWRWRPPRQRLLTGVGPSLPWAESRQALGWGWSAGGVSLGSGGSWLYAIVHGDRQAPGPPVRRYGDIDPTASAALAGLEDVIEVRPASLRVRRWACDGALLMGDAAHGMLPHLGLGGSQTLEDVPVLTDVLVRALRRGDTRAETLAEFQRRRARRVAYARRVSELWAAATTSAVPGSGHVRDLSLRRASRRPELIDALVRELSATGLPRLRTRLGLLLP